jgi:hypothetical protein
MFLGDKKINWDRHNSWIHRSPRSHRKEEKSPLYGFQFIWKQKNYGLWGREREESKERNGIGLVLIKEENQK